MSWEGSHLSPPILITFCRGTIESILGSWFGNCTQVDRKNLQRVVRTAKQIIGVTLPSISDIYTTRCIHNATSIVEDPTHPSHRLFCPFPSGRRYYSIRSVTTRLQNSFFPKATRLLDAQGLIWSPLLPCCMLTCVTFLYLSVALLHLM